MHFAMATVCAMMRGLIKEVLSAVVPNPDKIVVVPTGVDSEFFQPMDTGDCKTELASAFQNEAIRHLPLVLLFLLSLSLEKQAFVEKLAVINPQIFFMVSRWANDCICDL